AGDDLADRVVEADQTLVDELQGGDRGDRLGDAGDAEPVGHLGRVTGHALAEGGRVDQVPVDHHGDPGGVVPPEAAFDGGVEGGPRRQVGGGMSSVVGNDHVADAPAGVVGQRLARPQIGDDVGGVDLGG